jgi:hypothetical protein
MFVSVTPLDSGQNSDLSGDQRGKEGTEVFMDLRCFHGYFSSPSSPRVEPPTMIPDLKKSTWLRDINPAAPFLSPLRSALYACLVDN